MAEMEEYMGAYLSVVFVKARNVHVGRLRKNVRALSVAYPRTGFLHFSRKLAVLQNRPRIISARSDAPKIIPDEASEIVALVARARDSHFPWLRHEF
jgi:hypothetical protein